MAVSECVGRYANLFECPANENGGWNVEGSAEDTNVSMIARSNIGCRYELTFLDSMRAKRAG